MITRLKRPVRQPRQKRRRKPITFTSNMNKADFEKFLGKHPELRARMDKVAAEREDMNRRDREAETGKK